MRLNVINLPLTSSISIFLPIFFVLVGAIMSFRGLLDDVDEFESVVDGCRWGGIGGVFLNGDGGISEGDFAFFTKDETCSSLLEDWDCWSASPSFFCATSGVLVSSGLDLGDSKLKVSWGRVKGEGFTGVWLFGGLGRTAGGGFFGTVFFTTFNRTSSVFIAFRNIS